MSGFYLALAILLEVAGTTCMKLSDGFAKRLPATLMVLFYAGCFTALTMALKKLELGTVYAIWSGVGTTLVAVVGILYFKEALTPLKVVSILLIVLGVIGLQLSRSGH